VYLACLLQQAATLACEEKAPAMDEVPLSPEKDVAASPAKGTAAPPVLIRGLDWAPDSVPASPAKDASASPVLIRGLDWAPDSAPASPAKDASASPAIAAASWTASSANLGAALG